MELSGMIVGGKGCSFYEYPSDLIDSMEVEDGNLWLFDANDNVVAVHACGSWEYATMVAPED